MKKPLINQINKDVRQGIWQYLLDHSQVWNNGVLQIHLIFRDEMDLWRRIQARVDGKYHRYEIEDKLIKQEIKKDLFTFNRIHNESSAKMAKEVNRIKNEGTDDEKRLLFLYQYTRAKIFPFALTPRQRKQVLIPPKTNQ